MWDRQHPVFWSFPVARVWRTEIRCSWWMPLLALLFVVQFGWQLGLAYSVILVLAVLLHEFGHVAMARATGGSADEINLSPIGGLAVVQPGPGFWSQFLTPAAGPLVNLVLCVLFYPGFYAPELVGKAFDLRYFPLAALHRETLAIELFLLAFAANWLLLAINLLPTFPFDCGQMLHASLVRQLPAESVFRGMMTVGIVLGVALMVTGLIVPWPALIFLGAIVLVFNVILSMQGRMTEYADDSFMGYDFSQGYTSLERSSGQVSEKAPRVSRWQRWKEKREAKRQELAREKQLQDETQLDELLAKVHLHGVNSLTRTERKTLERVSSEYRERSKRQS